MAGDAWPMVQDRLTGLHHDSTLQAAPKFDIPERLTLVRSLRNVTLARPALPNCSAGQAFGGLQDLLRERHLRSPSDRAQGYSRVPSFRNLTFAAWPFKIFVGRARSSSPGCAGGGWHWVQDHHPRLANDDTSLVDPDLPTAADEGTHRLPRRLRPTDHPLGADCERSAWQRAVCALSRALLPSGPVRLP